MLSTHKKGINMKIIRGLFQWALLGAFTLTAMFLGAQTFPPGGGAGGAASAPTSQVDGCVIPGYNFATLTAMGMCHDDGTGPYGFNAVAVQTSDPTDLEYAGLVCSEGDPTFCQAIAFDDGGNNGVSFFWQAIGVTTPAAQFVLRFRLHRGRHRFRGHHRRRKRCGPIHPHLNRHQRRGGLRCCPDRAWAWALHVCLRHPSGVSEWVHGLLLGLHECCPVRGCGDGKHRQARERGLEL